MDKNNQKSEGRIAVRGPASPQVGAYQRAVSVGAAGIFVLAAWGAAIDARANSLGKEKTAPEKEIPRSVFVVPANLKEGRNPFYPHSIRGMTQQQAPVRPSQPVADVSELVLNGIVPSGPRRTAMINGRTFEVGEESEVKLPDGQKLLVKVEAIKDDSAVVSVRGQRRELHLRRGL
jgi:hypothetical protein